MILRDAGARVEQEQGMADGRIGTGSPGKRENAFLSTVDDIILQWTQMWVADAAHDEAISTNVQVMPS